MLINRIQSHNIKTTPTFRSLGYTPAYYTDMHGVNRATQNTTDIRNDLNYNKLAKILQTRFAGFDRVNILPMNVSDGTEAYCIANAIIRNEGLENFKQKYSPIRATDVCRDVIETYGQEGFLHLYTNETPLFRNIGIDILFPAEKKINKNYILYQEKHPERFFKLNPEYSKLFDFQVMDLQERLNKIQDEGNSVVIIRNCLKQSFGNVTAPYIIKKVSEILTGKSLLITGSYDTSLPVIKDALVNNFQKIERNIWALKK